MVRIFRQDWKLIFKYAPMILVFGLFFSLNALMIIFLLQAMISSDAGIYIIILIEIPFCIIFFGLLLFITMPFVQILFTHIKVSPTGFEYRRFPFSCIRGRWEEVEKLQTGTLNTAAIGFMGNFIPNRQLANLVIRRSTPGVEIHIRNGTIGSANYHYISLLEFKGWADGSLEKVLREYAPHVFK